MSITVTIDRWPHDPTGRAITVQVHENGVPRCGKILTRDAETAQAIVRDTIARVLGQKAEPRRVACSCASAPDGRKPLTPEQIQDLRSRLSGPSAPAAVPHGDAAGDGGFHGAERGAVALAEQRVLDAEDRARRRRIRERITGRSTRLDARDTRGDSAGEAVSA